MPRLSLATAELTAEAGARVDLPVEVEARRTLTLALLTREAGTYGARVVAEGDGLRRERPFRLVVAEPRAERAALEGRVYVGVPEGLSPQAWGGRWYRAPGGGLFPDRPLRAQGRGSPSSPGSGAWPSPASPRLLDPGGNTGLGPEAGILGAGFLPGQGMGWRYLQGSSQAAPHVAGAAAILLGMGADPDAAQGALPALEVEGGLDLRPGEAGALPVRVLSPTPVPAGVYPEGGLSAYLFPNPAEGEAVLRVYAPEATPPGPHRLLAFLDRDGDGLLDRDEPWAEAQVSAPARGVRLLVR